MDPSGADSLSRRPADLQGDIDLAKQAADDGGAIGE